MEKVICLILDGWGLSARDEGNAIKLADTPNFDRFWHKYPRAVLESSGKAVGLPEGQMGTSEVNHMTIGAGRVIFQDLVRINQAIEKESFYDNQAIIDAFKHVKKNNSTLHIKGLISPGGVHSHQEHVYALLKGAKMHGIEDVYIHVFTDGRDVAPRSAKKYVKELEQKIEEIGVGKIVSIAGRYYAMDRNKNWERTDKTFDLLTSGKGKKYSSVEAAIDAFYDQGVTDEFFEPSLIEVQAGEEGTISTDDAVVFVNFRNDRPRQLVERFLEKGPDNLEYVTMTQYNPDYQVKVAYDPVEVNNSLGELLSQEGLKQLRITETEKFAHLTFFLNCKREAPFEGEDRMMFDSFSDVDTYDEKPKMRTPDIKREIIESIRSGSHEVIFTNLCNGDMVGHTGDMEAAVKGIETVDKAVGEIVEAALEEDYHLILTADHGNAEEMIEPETGEVKTAHTTNPVPFVLISNKYKSLNRMEGSLQDIAPTILQILGIDQPEEMTGKSLLE
jgi:2,3-bisphosphoglycerate-independent phosphoglycerate mutase